MEIGEWEDYFQNYVSKYPNMEFAKVAEQIAKKLGIRLEELVSNSESSDIIDSIWIEDDRAGTRYIDDIAKARRVSIEQLLLDPEGMEVINTFYRERDILDFDNPEIQGVIRSKFACIPL